MRATWPNLQKLVKEISKPNVFELQTEAWRLSFVILHPNIICEPLQKELTPLPGDFRRAPPIARGRWGRVDLLRFTTANAVFIFDPWCGRPQESRNHAETSCIEDGCTVTTCTRSSRPMVGRLVGRGCRSQGGLRCGDRCQWSSRGAKWDPTTFLEKSCSKNVRIWCSDDVNFK